MSNEHQRAWMLILYTFGIIWTFWASELHLHLTQVKPDDCMWTLIDNKIAGTWMNLRFRVHFGVRSVPPSVQCHKSQDVTRCHKMSQVPQPLDILWPHFDPTLTIEIAQPPMIANCLSGPILDLETKVQITLEKFDNMKWEDPVWVWHSRHARGAQWLSENSLGIRLVDLRFVTFVIGLSLVSSCLETPQLMTRRYYQHFLTLLLFEFLDTGITRM